MDTLVFLLSFLLIIINRISIAVPLDTITETHFLKDNDTIVSSNETFEMGFFSPGKSNKWYIGIWYKNISNKTVVWVANRENPVINKTGSALKITNKGVLSIVTDFNYIISISDTSSRSSSPVNPVAQLLDSGNLVIRDENDSSKNVIWQSFDHPTDTQLPDMKIGWNLKTGRETYMTTWKNDDDPGAGEFTFHLDPTGYPQIMIRKGRVVKCRNGPWVGDKFSGRPSAQRDNIYKRVLVFNQEEVYYTYELIDSSTKFRFMLDQDAAKRFVWVNSTQQWNLYIKFPIDDCDNYSLCGLNSLCNINTSPICACLKEFVPRFLDKWAMENWSGGCVRNTSLDWEKGVGFSEYKNVKLPDSRSSWFLTSMDLKQCKAKCLKNCSCTAYSNLDFRDGGSGCLLWFNDLIDMRYIGDTGQYIYVKIPSDHHNLKKRVIVAVSLLLLVGIVLLGISSFLWKKKAKLTTGRSFGEKLEQDYSNNRCQTEDLELPLFDLSTIVDATNNFSIHNKLGEGGFGPVYKGVLEGGQEIAVKRLSETSKQGFHEFKNEVMCIAKLQHRNLVKLLGYCTHGDEQMLIYEYVPNNSLNTYIFNETQRKLLDWPICFNIINGIARGLLYLHQDSRLRIIHRDLKASNVLLDFEMNPKISDFGLARSFAGNETGGNTRRVVGTYGYMSPEYAVDGLFSVKSDVFSYGVLVLEIVSGKRNRGFIHQDHQHNLLGHVWSLHLEGKLLELVDEVLITDKECFVNEVLRSIQVGLLCVQQNPEDRPNMMSVMLMLSGEGPLLQPKQPGFFTQRSVHEASSSFSHARSSCIEISSSLSHGR